MSKELTKDDTKIIKGIAIILMIMHHLWTYADRLPNGALHSYFNVFGSKFPIFFGTYGKICVSLFFFIGGFGLYLSSKKKDIDIISRIKKLFISYWKVFLIFIPIAFIFFRNQTSNGVDVNIYTKYSNFRIGEFISNLLGVSSSYNEEWWFLKSYMFAIITFPLIKNICEKYKNTTCYLLVIIFSILAKNILPALGNLDVLGNLNTNTLYNLFFCQSAPYIACFWMGILVAKDNLINKIYDSLNNNFKINILFDLIVLFVIIFLRQCGYGDNFDIIYIPFMIIAILDICSKLKFIKVILSKLGKQSTNMWLIHSFLCYYFVAIAKIITIMNDPIISLLELIVLTYLLSLLVDLIWKYINKAYKFILKRKEE